MPEAATIESAVIDKHIDTEPTPKGTFVNDMASKMNAAMLEVAKNAKEPKSIDTRPVEQVEAKKEPVKPALKVQELPKESEPPKPAEPAKEAKEQKPAKGEAEMFSSPHWKELVASRDEWKQKAKASEKLEAEINDYKTKLADFQSKSANPEEVETLRKERQTLHDKLERVALEHSEKFSSYYNSKFEDATNLAVDAAGKDKADQVKAILEAPKSTWRKAALNELISSMENEVDKLNLIQATNEYDRIRGERQKQLDDHKVNISKLREVEQQKQKEAQEQDAARRKDFVKEVLKNQAVKFEAFQEKDGDKDHNEAVKKSRKLVEDFVMGAMDDATAISLPLKAAEYERISKLVPELQAKVKEQEDALTALRGAAPKPGEANANSTTQTNQVESFKEKVMRLMPKSQ